MRILFPRRRRRAADLPLLLAVLAVAAGCADVEGAASEGDLGTVHAPRTLWKDIRPQPAGPGERPASAAVVPGLPRRTGPPTMRGVNALEVVRADFASATAQDGGSGRLVDPRAVQRLALCTQAVDGGPRCPVRPAVLADVTGDGREDLITAVDIDGRSSELRVYTVRNDGSIARILSRHGILDGVEVAGEHVTVREPTSNPAKVSVSDYAWDPAAGLMKLSQLTLDECTGPRDGGVPCSPGH